MGVKILGVDTPLSSQAEVPFEGDVDIPGQYGPGGFYKPDGVPSLVGSAAGQQGTSISTIPKGAYINPSTGQPEMLTGPGGLVEKTRGQMNPLGFAGRGNPYWRGAIAGAGVIAPTQVAPGTLTPAQLAHGPSDPADLLPKSTPNFVRPEGEIQRTFPSWPTPGPGAAPAAAPLPPSRPVTPTPATAYPQQVTPTAAGPAAVAQQPNLGNYGASPFTTLDYRPNSGPNERNRGSPQATALDLSRLFGGGAPTAPSAAPVAAPTYSQPSIQLIERSKAPGTMGPLQKGAVWPKEMGPKKRKSSSTSEGGGY
jgi:hypothetical protein